MVAAFQEQNSIRIAVSCKVLTHQGKPDMLYQAEAWTLQVLLTDPKPSVLASAICWGREYMSLMGLFTSLLYKLDFQLAELEMRGQERQR